LLGSAVSTLLSSNDIRTIGFESPNFGKVTGVNEEETAGGTQGDGAKQKKGEGDAVNQFPAAQTQRDGGRLSIKI
jgi:hypothetical protein